MPKNVNHNFFTEFRNIIYFEILVQTRKYCKEEEYNFSYYFCSFKNLLCVLQNVGLESICYIEL